MIFNSLRGPDIEIRTSSSIQDPPRRKSRSSVEEENRGGTRGGDNLFTQLDNYIGVAGSHITDGNVEGSTKMPEETEPGNPSEVADPFTGGASAAMIQTQGGSGFSLMRRMGSGGYR